MQYDQNLQVRAEHSADKHFFVVDVVVQMQYIGTMTLAMRCVVLAGDGPDEFVQFGEHRAHLCMGGAAHLSVAHKQSFEGVGKVVAQTPDACGSHQGTTATEILRNASKFEITF